MDRKQVFTAIVSVLVFFAALVGAAYFGGGASQVKSKGIKFKQGPKKAKTVVNQKMYDALASEKPAQPSPAPDVREQTQSSEPTAPPATAQPVASPEQTAVHEAMNALTPQQGIDRLTALLATLEQVEEASRVYTALGTLYAQTGEAGAPLAEQAFADAKKAARSQEDQDRATLALVNALTVRGEIDKAASEAKAALAPDKPVTAAGLELGIAQGKLLEKKGAAVEAEAQYELAMQQALQAARVLHEPGVNSYRQACLALVQLYRKTGREPLANSLIISMKSNIAKITPSAGATGP